MPCTCPVDFCIFEYTVPYVSGAFASVIVIVCYMSDTCFYRLYPEDLELLLDRVNDLVQFRIDAVLQEMSGATLCTVPEDEPVTCEEFVQTTKVRL